MRRTLPLLVVLASCGGDGQVGSGGDAVNRPKFVEALELMVTPTALPAELQDDAGLHLTVGNDGTTLVGGARGLFQLEPDGLHKLDDHAVLGLAATSDALLVATDQGLFTWNGSLTTAPIASLLGEAQAISLGTRGDELWIGASDALVQVVGDKSFRFPSLTNVASILSFAGADALVLSDAMGAVNVLRSDAMTFSTQALADELPNARVMPAQGGRLLGVDQGALLERTAVEGGAAWRTVALTSDPGDLGAGGVQALAVDPVTGSVWVVHAGGIARITGARVANQIRPDGLGTVTLAAVTGDGALWISDGQQLFRLGEVAGGAGTGPVTYEMHVKPFLMQNCNRCHVELGRSHPLTSYELVKEEADDIIKALEEGRMPDDGKPLVGGGVDLIRRWRAGGLLQ